MIDIICSFYPAVDIMKQIYIDLFRLTGWMYGDPHFHTLDGFQYTFNGLGEYTLVETIHGNFTLQGRTAKALDANGAEMDATVFSAFAAKDVDSATVHIGMNAARKGTCQFCNTYTIRTNGIPDFYVRIHY